MSSPAEALHKQRVAFGASEPSTAKERIAKLKALRKQLCRYQDVFR